MLNTSNTWKINFPQILLNVRPTITSVWAQFQTVCDYKHHSSHYTFPLSSPVGPALNTIFTHSRNAKIEHTSLFPTQLQRRRRRRRRRRKCWLLSCVWFFVNPWTVTHQAPLSMVFSQQEYWTGVPFPSPGNFPNPGNELESPVLQIDSLLSESPGASQLQRGYLFEIIKNSLKIWG